MSGRQEGEKYKGYVKVSECQSFWNWLSDSWCFPCGWNGPYRKLYEHGHRFFGFESYEVRAHLADE